MPENQQDSYLLTGRFPDHSLWRNCEATPVASHSLFSPTRGYALTRIGLLRQMNKLNGPA
ncbi:MAG: hypothetical protein COW18_03735 [Zetaproteobacteria bacterium CG12_big_fil_rev_8_21_14_0_65_54_13]|nr:MAG: hypothetical protein COX55_02315 [Zetaproteobacteria bacterium CG23_combo_of_CG06-09_8_20_14_all_54_7]PIW50328.1 MAG: hypothetical protein COW18_03735 [Zetaproteobacteria bacterium CG12_big_fil_rev_8_21_14_0_65_54_13]PIX55387.1 MAG: hypothetical protein COZ50_03110 [Zetaproteobacteria bacterium CG_4_10_14_3_um_filter_54_28]PJA27124.1 MAG: hypothetical protein CO188_13180 [Zetaproteobacteria bacterium CG_4_9_14_3_um_filter_54_145]